MECFAWAKPCEMPRRALANFFTTLTKPASGLGWNKAALGNWKRAPSPEELMMGHTIEVQGDTVWVILEGTLTLEGLQSAFDAMVSHPRFRPGMACVWDERAVTSGP